MTQEEKNLVLIDLCGRLPYDIVINDEYGDYTNVNIHNVHIEHLIDRVVSGLDKMVLRSLSSMTEEEYNELKKISSYYGFAPFEDIHNWAPNYNLIDWFNRKMFDFRDLIPKGLAIEAPEDVYND
jgi:hypothetical protein